MAGSLFGPSRYQRVQRRVPEGSSEAPLSHRVFISQIPACRRPSAISEESRSTLRRAKVKDALGDASGKGTRLGPWGVPPWGYVALRTRAAVSLALVTGARPASRPCAHRSLTAVDKAPGGRRKAARRPLSPRGEPALRRGEAAPSPTSADVPLTQFQRLDSGRAARRLHTGWSAPQRQDCVGPLSRVVMLQSRSGRCVARPETASARTHEP
ncbi:hypothetical protein HPB47_002730 [Ixodes persulcatus]|uniref:Uncharacterized protein n=1 Tax=Ixodes persulcatus TaxID=34615 RepID=A0AC60PKC6_IXOPE|nr:hypothetical protein HPB47_002730 [Ixodes persulcatus]